jgi:hypothetical protein
MKRPHDQVLCLRSFDTDSMRWAVSAALHSFIQFGRGNPLAVTKSGPYHGSVESKVRDRLRK